MLEAVLDPRSPASPPWLYPRAAYIHVPFCAHRCTYCDFAIAVGRDQLVDQYIDALIAEMSTLGQPQPVQTLFLGGGTPTHMHPAQLARLLAAILHWLPPEPGHEFTIEANPGTLDTRQDRHSGGTWHHPR